METVENNKKDLSLIEKLSEIQIKLNVPKGQYNKYGKFNFRSAEDILTALKPVLKEYQLCLLLNDEIVEIGGRIFVKATVKLLDLEKNEVTNTGFAELDKEPIKGMNEAQKTGSASSYARKYALNGLFAIDDIKDADTNEYAKIRNGSNTETVKETKIPISKVEIRQARENLKNVTAKGLERFKQLKLETGFEEEELGKILKERFKISSIVVLSNLTENQFEDLEMQIKRILVSMKNN